MANYTLYKNYFVRQAVMPLSEALKNPLINTSELVSIDEVCRNPFFRQALLCASESLYDSMNEYIAGKIDNAKRKKQIELAICQYWMRMSTRATPFGLFSSVGIGSTMSDCESGGFFSVIDADSEWLYSLSKLVEKEYLERLTFITNDLIGDEGSFFTLPYVPGVIDESPVLIEKSPITTYIVEQCKNTHMSFQELVEGITHLYPEVDNSHIRLNIDRLLSRDFILSPLRPNLHCTNLISSFLNKLREHHIANELATQLEDVVEKIDYISRHIFAETTEQELLLLISSLRRINNTSRVLKIDLLKKTEQGVLTKEDIAGLEDFANFFIAAITHLKSRFTVYNEYKDLFLNEYGDYRMVQLTQLIDPRLGIGLPHTFKEFHKKKRGQKVYLNEPTPEFLRYFMQKYRQALQSGSAIFLDDLIEKIGFRESIGDAPSSFDLIFKVATDDEGKKVFICNKDFGCIGAGRTIGRFSANWGEATNIMRNISSLENSEDDCIVCDLVYMPKRLHLGNVATGSKLHEYSLSFYQYTTQHNIPISDLYVMVENNKFQLVSKQLGKKVKVNTSNLLYYYGDSPEIRFIKEIQFDGVVRWEYDTFDNLQLFDYIPEIRYKSVILRPETWSIIPPAYFDNFDKFDNWFVEEYGFLKDKKVSLLYADNELLINMNNQQSRYLAYKQYLREKKITLIKYCNGDNSSYATEVALPFICADKSLKRNAIEDIMIKSNMISLVPNQTLPLGNEWVTIKLYGCKEPEKYLSLILKNAVDEMISAGLVDAFFFLHYADPMYHIRVRLFKKDGPLEVDKIIASFNNHVKMGLISRFDLSSYNREVERYGGYEGTRAAEKIFCIESQAAMHLQLCFTVAQREKIFVKLCLEYLGMWNWNKKKQLEWIDKKCNSKKYSVQWRKYRIEYNDFYLTPTEEYFSKELLEKWVDAIKAYQLRVSDDALVQGRILSALLHMFFNRSFGMNREKEERLLVFTRNLLQDILRREEQSNDNSE